MYTNMNTYTYRSYTAQLCAVCVCVWASIYTLNKKHFSREKIIGVTGKAIYLLVIYYWAFILIKTLKEKLFRSTADN